MREKLIKKLFEEFERDKYTIKKNLLMVMNEIMLSTENDYEKITLTIKMEKK